MAGTIVADRIQSDDTYPSKIELASPVLVTNEFSVQASGNTGVFNIVGANTSATRTVTLPDGNGTLATLESIPTPTIASTAEAQAGTNNTNFITPLRMREGFNASGSAPVYACRAWVNFNGTLSNPITPRGNGNISSVTKSGTGQYVLNFTTAMPDANFTAVVSGCELFAGFNSNDRQRYAQVVAQTASNVSVQSGNVTTAAFIDLALISVSVFR